jgi:cytosine/uracil/thiamine/allantoin permease
MAAQRKVDIGLILLIAIQWVLVGAFPLVHPKRPWGEPGMLITICAVLSLTGVLIRPIEDIGKLLAGSAALTWLVWFGLLIWKLVRSAWHRITHRPRFVVIP